MRGPHNIWRLIRTGATFERSGALSLALEAMQAPKAFRIAATILSRPFRFLGLKGDETLAPVPRALTALGPAYIKFGQIMSTRPDVVGDELAAELRMLQDALPAFPDEVAKSEIEHELGAPLETLFSEFGPPVAAASLAQVHRATTLSNGREVAVKVLRPGIEKAFLRDVDAFYLIAWFVETLAPQARRLKPREVIEHFETIVRGELDLRMEASAAAEFYENTKDDAGFSVPQVVWPLSSRRVLTLDWVDGIKFGDEEAMRKSGADMPAIAARTIQSFLNSALRDGYFHADMHHGNLKLAPNGDIVALDFGIMGRIDTFTRRVYAEILIGFLRRDYRRIAEVHFEAGYVPRDRDIDDFAQALRSVGEPIFGQGASEISMGHLLQHLFEVTEKFGMETRTELILLQRTMVVVEGVARSLDPELNMWETARPVVETYIRENLGPKAIVRDLVEAATILTRLGPRLPLLAEQLLLDTNTGKAPITERGYSGWIWFFSGLVVGIILLSIVKILS